MRIRLLSSFISVLVPCLVICAQASGQNGALTLVAENGNGTTFLEDVGVSYGLPFTASGGVAPYTYSVISGQLPAGETLSATSGQVSGAPATIGNYTFTVQVQDSASSKATLTVMVPVFADPAVVTTSVPAGGVGGMYSTTLMASGGYPSYQGGGFAYSWSITNGALPAGLTLGAATGVISGTPTAAGVYNFTVDVSDGSFDAQQALTLTIGAQAPLQIPGGSGGAQITLPGGTVSTPYSQVLSATNGNPPYTWAVLGGGLPQGLALSSSGTLSGTPSQPGGALFTAKVTDTAGATASAVFTITIAPQTFTITTGSTLPNGIVASDYPAQIVGVTGGIPTLYFPSRQRRVARRPHIIARRTDQRHSHHGRRLQLYGGRDRFQLSRADGPSAVPDHGSGCASRSDPFPNIVGVFAQGGRHRPAFRNRRFGALERGLANPQLFGRFENRCAVARRDGNYSGSKHPRRDRHQSGSKRAESPERNHADFHCRDVHLPQPLRGEQSDHQRIFDREFDAPAALG